MGTWGTSIKDNDAFADIYSEFFELYDKGGQPNIISKKIIEDNWEILEIEEERNSLWFALALAQWETKSLEPKILLTVDEIISSGADLKVWLELGAGEQDIKKRKIALDKFLNKIKADRPKAKPRKRVRLKTPIFATGDCLVFKISNGNYGGAIVLATDNNPETAYNLVATTRLNQINKPTISDFENSEVLICNFGQWQDKPDVNWYMPDLFHKDYSGVYEFMGNLLVEIQYDVKNREGKGYLFKPFFTAGWDMKSFIEKQIESELTKPKPSEKMSMKRLIKKDKLWKF